MKMEMRSCDVCEVLLGSKSNCAYLVCLERKLDAAGSLDDVVSEVDLCDGCLRRVVQMMLKAGSPDFWKTAVGKRFMECIEYLKQE